MLINVSFPIRFLYVCIEECVDGDLVPVLQTDTLCCAVGWSAAPGGCKLCVCARELC